MLEQSELATGLKRVLNETGPGAEVDAPVVGLRAVEDQVYSGFGVAQPVTPCVHSHPPADHQPVAAGCGSAGGCE